MYCENCGTKIDEGEKFCSNCGQQIDQANNQPVPGVLSASRGSAANMPRQTGRLILKKHCSDLLFVIGVALFFIAQVILAVSMVQTVSEIISDSGLKELFAALEMADDLGVSIPVSVWLMLLFVVVYYIGTLAAVIYGVKLALAMFNVFSESSGYEAGGSTTGLRNVNKNLCGIGKSVVTSVFSLVFCILSMLWALETYAGYDYDDLGMGFWFWFWVVICLALATEFYRVMYQDSVHVMVYSRVIEYDDAYFSKDYSIVMKNLICGIIMIALVIYVINTEAYKTLTEMIEVNTSSLVAIIINGISLIIFSIKIQMIDTEIEHAVLR